MSHFTQADLEKLENAFARGMRTVSLNGRSTTFASAEEMSRTIEYVRRQITKSTGRQRLLAEFSKGVQ